MTQARQQSGRHRGRTQRSSGTRLARRTVQVIAALVSTSLLLAMGYYRYTYTSLDGDLHRVAVGGLGSSASAASGVKQVDGAAQNLLVIGSDSRAGLSAAEIKKLHVGAADATTSTDTLMIVHVPANGAKATLVSIPRDTYVQIPGFAPNKINAAFIDGYDNGTDGYPVTSSSTEDQKQAAGITLLLRVIKNLTGLEIDHYVMVSFLGFYNIAKAIGGITVDLCHAVDDTVAYNEAHGEGVAGSGFVQTAGVHALTPVESLEFVRQRHNLVNAKGEDLGDIGREARQRYFLAKAFDKVASAGTLVNPGKLSSLIDAVRSTLTIDDGLSLQDLARQMLDLSSGNIVGQTIPVAGSETFPSPVGDALTVDIAKVHAAVQRWLSGSAPSPSASSSTGATARPSASSSSSSGVASAAPAGCIN